MKNKKIFGISLFTILLVFIGINVFNVTAANDNILSNTGSWKSYFGGNAGWGTASGSLSSTSDDNFETNITSTGNVQNEWTIQAEFDSNASLTSGQYYVYSANIISDKNRTIYIKFQGESDSDIIAEKWIDLKAGETYNLSLDFISNNNYSNFKIFYALGWNTKDSIGGDATNNIKVTDINLIEKELDYSQFSYIDVKQGSATATDYKYYSISGLQAGADVLAHVYPKDSVSTSIYFPVGAAPVTKVTVNGTEVDFYTNGGALAYIKLDNFYKEYNEVNILNNGGLISKIIVKNTTKTTAIEQVKSYLTDNSSDGVKQLIEDTIEDVNNAKTNNEVTQILNGLPNAIKLVELQESKDSAIEKINTYLTNDASDEVKNIIETAINDINSITTRDEVDARLNIFIIDVTLQINKDTAIEELTEYIGTNYSNEVKNIYEDAIEKINNAITDEEIIEIVVNTKTDIDTQIEKEKSEEESKDIIPDIPLTLDNIVIYVILLIVAVVAIVYLSKRLLKKKKDK